MRKGGGAISFRRLQFKNWRRCGVENDLLGGTVLVLMMLPVIVKAEAVTVTVGTALVRVTNCVVVWRDRAISLACAEGGPSGHLEFWRIWKDYTKHDIWTLGEEFQIHTIVLPGARYVEATDEAHVSVEVIVTTAYVDSELALTAESDLARCMRSNFSITVTLFGFHGIRREGSLRVDLQD